VLAGFGENTRDPWTIPPGGEGSGIGKHTSREDLVRLYGTSNVIDRDVDLGEGETEPGTVVFSLDPQRSIEILWKDPATKRTPKQFQIQGKVSFWKTVHEISLGTSLKELERLNGRPFLLTGFEWDYSGTETSWKGGALEKELQRDGHLILRLGPREPIDVSKGELTQVLGDSDFSSHHPVMQKVNPRVYQIVWIFP
jgi:hypothetical protein